MTQKDIDRGEAWGKWVQARNPYAIGSLVLGIFSIIEFGAIFVFGIAGIVTGIMAIKKLKAATGDDPQLGGRLAWTGIVLSAISLIIGGILVTYRR